MESGYDIAHPKFGAHRAVGSILFTTGLRNARCLGVARNVATPIKRASLKDAYPILAPCNCVPRSDECLRSASRKSAPCSQEQRKLVNCVAAEVVSAVFLASTCSCLFPVSAHSNFASRKFAFFREASRISAAGEIDSVEVRTIQDGETEAATA